MSKTNAAEIAVLDYLLRTRDAQMYLALFTSDPGEAGDVSGEPATANGYARQAIDFDDGTNPITATPALNVNSVAHGPNTTADWGGIGWWGVCRSNVRGTADVVYKGARTGGVLAIAVGDTATTAVGAISIGED